MFFFFLKKFKFYYLNFCKQFSYYLWQPTPEDDWEKRDFKNFYKKDMCEQYQRNIDYHFKVLCYSYVFFTKFCGHVAPYVANFNKFFFKLGKNVWYIDFKKIRILLKSTHMSVFTWYLFYIWFTFFEKRYFSGLFYTSSCYSRKSNLFGITIEFINFFNLLVYLVCKKDLLINYKSLKQFIVIWPKFYLTDDFLFYIADSEKYNFSNCNRIIIKKKKKFVKLIL